MGTDFLTILALVWVIYMFLFTESDRQLSELLNRLKASLAINDKGTFQLTQFWAKQSFGISEIIDLGNAIKNGHSNKTNINKFHRNYQEINQGKIFLIVNLFLLSFNIIILSLVWFPSFLITIFRIHIVLSLIFGFIFYYYLNKLHNLAFMTFKVKSPKKEDSSQASTS
ncbi:MAG: hypothetical protein COS98_00140 [Parcubacteria group bacterium CG07_land_8_20_14_0_80_35_11]|nr:MAG: hypothetical protein COS98_00140 [Parcubacteria group bacterium CG07_land_8_20_14_0_80_35_11]